MKNRSLASSRSKGRDFDLTIGFTPPSKKNQPRRLTVPGRGRIVAPSKNAVLAQEAIRTLAQQYVGPRLDGRPLFEGNDVRLELTWDVRLDTVRIRVIDLGPPPKKHKGRRRDLHSIIDVIADALQRVVYANDNQVSELVVRKVR